jgi:hypothetical protein
VDICSLGRPSETRVLRTACIIGSGPQRNTGRLLRSGTKALKSSALMYPDFSCHLAERAGSLADNLDWLK